MQTIILSFAIGFLLAALGVNVLSNLADILQIFTDWIKAAVSVHIAKCGAKIQEYNNSITQEETGQSSVHAIGFEVPQDYEYEEEDYD